MEAFKRPKVTLDTRAELGVRTLPELVDFHAAENPQHLFCLQVEKNNTSVPVSYARLQNAIARCQIWLKDQAIGLHTPIMGTDGLVRKCAPAAILTESHVGLPIYVLACMGMGIPVVLLSARLSAAAVCHLIRKTGVKVILVSSRLQPLATEAFPMPEIIEREANEKEEEIAVRVLDSYEVLLGELEPGQLPKRIAHSSHFVSEEDRQVLVLHSSGTSGLPKPIPCSHRYLLGYATCHSFTSDEVAHGLTVSTPPFFHGFGFVSICMSLYIGKTICVPPPSMIPSGASIASLIQTFGVKALLTVPSILEDIESLPDGEGHEVLGGLDFVCFGGGVLNLAAGKRLASAGVKLISQYGSTETGPLTPFYVPDNGYNYGQLRLRRDILETLELRLDRCEQPEQMQSGSRDTDSEQTFSYMLSMKPFGWQERFEVQDLIITKRELPHEGDIGQLDFTVAGRTDDLIVLATGEKVRPTILESLLKKEEGIKDAIAFGAQQFEIGIIVESDKFVAPNDVEAFKATIWPVIEEAGRQMDSHAQITSPAAILVVSPDSLARSDKGSILRQAVTIKFAAEIADVYRKLETSSEAPPLNLLSPQSSIRALVIEKLKWKVPENDLHDDDDFFALGMDSLQSTRLRRFLSATLRATHATSETGDGQVPLIGKITDDFVYRHPSINKIVGALMPRHLARETMISEDELIDQLVEKYTSNVGKRESVVLLTGATGSLGSYLLRQLLMDSSVARIICLNRPGKGDAVEAQKQAMRARDLLVSDDMWARVTIRQTNTAAPRLGLDEQEYEHLATDVTHILHVAWPMNFKMCLESFDASFKSLQNLIQLARRASSSIQPTKPRLLFMSSISTVGNHPSVHRGDQIPEVAVEESHWTLELGYAKAKLVCERMIQHAASHYPEIETSFVRIGQIAGASSGYWNANEHFVAVCISSWKIGKFPNLPGTFSWLPVDLAAQILTEILFDQLPLQQVYHLENHVRQGWKEAIILISKELQISDSSTVPLEQWLNLISSVPGSGNPAASLIDFLRGDFLKMSCGSVVLDTMASRKASRTLAHMEAVGDEAIRGYFSYWKKIKLLHRCIGLRNVSEVGLQVLRSLILGVLGLPKDYPEDQEVAVGENGSGEAWPDFAALCEGFIYFFDIAPTNGTPEVKFHMTTRKYGTDDLTIARNLVEWMKAHGRGAWTDAYMGMMEKLAVHRGLENGKGMHVYISYQCTETGEPDVKSYISPELYHKGRYVAA